MRYCRFCCNSFEEDNTSHWVSNGKLKPRCKFKLIHYNAKNQNKKKIYNDIYYSKNRISILENISHSYVINRSHIASLRKNRRKQDPLLRLKDSYGSSAKRAFTQKGYKSKTKSAQILDCTYEQLITYIESQFAEDFNWENYGIIWEIDHICPLHQACSYEEVIKLCSYLNLRPLLVSLNRKNRKQRLLRQKQCVFFFLTEPGNRWSYFFKDRLF